MSGMNKNDGSMQSDKGRNRSGLIVDFMEIKEIESSYDNYGRPTPIWYAGYLGYRTPVFSVKGKSVEHLIKESKFLHSWDWLMPVYRKIRNIISERSRYGKDTFTHLDQLEFDVKISILEVDFQKSFDSIIKFIEYWNSLKAKIK